MTGHIQLLYYDQCPYELAQKLPSEVTDDAGLFLRFPGAASVVEICAQNVLGRKVYIVGVRFDPKR
jgi:hypothetical protein